MNASELVAAIRAEHYPDQSFPGSNGFCNACTMTLWEDCLATVAADRIEAALRLIGDDWIVEDIRVALDGKKW